MDSGFQNVTTEGTTHANASQQNGTVAEHKKVNSPSIMKWKNEDDYWKLGLILALLTVFAMLLGVYLLDYVRRRRQAGTTNTGQAALASDLRTEDRGALELPQEPASTATDQTASDQDDMTLVSVTDALSATEQSYTSVLRQ